MKITVIILVAIPVGIVFLFFVLALMSRSGHAPGLVDGKLSQCPDKKNCVCSEFKKNYRSYIEPINIPNGLTPGISTLLKKTIQDMGGRFQSGDENYLAFTFSSDIFGFVDDLELRLDNKQGVIHIRSASRVGYSDRSVNRKRVESLNKRITSIVQASGH